MDNEIGMEVSTVISPYTGKDIHTDLRIDMDMDIERFWTYLR
jgi:hypothetical protein